MSNLNTSQDLYEYFHLCRRYLILLNDKRLLLDIKRPRLKALYTSVIGCWQVERLRLQLEIKCLKLKIDLLETEISREENININYVELAVAAELADDELRISREIDKREKAKQILAENAQNVLLNRNYIELAIYLDPALNPLLTKEHANAWALLHEAYFCGDEEKFKALLLIFEYEIAAGIQFTKQEAGVETSFKIKALAEKIKFLEKEISFTCNQFPFTIEEKLKDENWIAAELQRIETELNDLTEYENELRNDYRSLLIS